MRAKFNGCLFSRTKHPKKERRKQKSGLRLKKNQYNHLNEYNDPNDPNEHNHLNEHNDPNHRNDIGVYRRHTKSLLFPLGEWLRVTAEKIC